MRKLRDAKGKALIIARIRRIEETGNFGDYRYLGAGIFELKINAGPGYRLYFSLMGDKLVIILMGGDKSSQQRDVTKAKDLRR